MAMYGPLVVIHGQFYGHIEWPLIGVPVPPPKYSIKFQDGSHESGSHELRHENKKHTKACCTKSEIGLIKSSSTQCLDVKEDDGAISICSTQMIICPRASR